jgi:hypothetical protein
MPHVVIKTAQHLLAAVQLRDLRAQAAEDRRELAGDVAAAADDQQALRKWIQVEHRIRHTHQVGARHIRHERPAAGGDQDVAGRQTWPPATTT